MYKSADNSKIRLTNAALYAVFQEYFGLTNAQMMDKKNFTVNSTSNFAFDSSVFHVNSVFTIRKVTTPEDVWQDAVADDTYDLRTTLSPTTTYNANQWSLSQEADGVLGVNNVFDQKVLLPNPLKQGQELQFSSEVKEVCIYTLSGQLLSTKAVSLNYQLPTTISTGVYILKLIANNGEVDTRKIIVKNYINVYKEVV